MMLYFSPKFSLWNLFYIQSWAIPLKKKNPDVMMVFPWFKKSVEELPGSPVIGLMGLIPRQRTKILNSCVAQPKKKLEYLSVK